jgi:hypothetical protein
MFVQSFYVVYQTSQVDNVMYETKKTPIIMIPSAFRQTISTMFISPILLELPAPAAGKHPPQDNLSFIDCLLKFTKIQIEDIFIVKGTFGRGSKKADTDIEPT